MIHDLISEIIKEKITLVPLYKKILLNFTIQICILKKKKIMAIYHGIDIHAYTNDIRAALNEKYTEPHWRDAMQTKDIIELLSSIKLKYPRHIGVKNIRQCIANGRLLDPELPPVNFLFILKQLWSNIQASGSFAHFKETLDQIGTTCRQGVTHRIYIDWLAFCQ